MNTYFAIPEEINHSFDMMTLEPAHFDALFAAGFRMLGYRFLRHQEAYHNGFQCFTMPLRVRLSEFTPSKSQRIVLKRNADLIVKRTKISYPRDENMLFDKHFKRVEDFMSDIRRYSPDAKFFPKYNAKFKVFTPDGLYIASSYVHWGEQGMSATYGIHDPDAPDNRSLGTFTMLQEMEYAKKLGLKYYYHGYAFDIPSAFDYKFTLNGLETYDWALKQWLPIKRKDATKWRSELKYLCSLEPDEQDMYRFIKRTSV
jgi:leucyl-tRNA---protein transferase